MGSTESHKKSVDKYLAGLQAIRVPKEVHARLKKVCDDGKQAITLITQLALERALAEIEKRGIYRFMEGQRVPDKKSGKTRPPADPRIPPAKIIERRKALGLTQQELADKIGSQLATVSSWEKGIAHPRFATQQLLCRALRIDPNTFEVPKNES